MNDVASSSSRLRALGGNAIAAAFGLALTFGVVEVALRIYNPVPLRNQGTNFILAPNQDFEREALLVGSAQLEPKAHIRTNELGFRGDPLPPEGERRVRIVTVGGSTTENKYVSNELTWPGLLGARLSKTVPSVYLSNAGLDGNSTFGHRALLDQIILPKLRPDYVVLLVGMNDAALAEPTPFDSDTVRETGARQYLRSSVAIDTARTLFRSWKARQAGVSYRGKPLRFEEEPKLILSEEEMAGILTTSAPAVAGYAKRLEALVDLIRAAHAEPVFLTQPSLYGDWTDPATGLAVGDLQITPRAGVAMPATNARLRGRALDAYNDVTRRVARERNVPLVDLAAEIPKDQALYIDWMHYSLAGNAAVADRAAPVLEAVLTRRYRCDPTVEVRLSTSAAAAEPPCPAARD